MLVQAKLIIVAPSKLDAYIVLDKNKELPRVEINDNSEWHVTLIEKLFESITKISKKWPTLIYKQCCVNESLVGYKSIDIYYTVSLEGLHSITDEYGWYKVSESEDIGDIAFIKYCLTLRH